MLWRGYGAPPQTYTLGAPALRIARGLRPSIVRPSAPPLLIFNLTTGVLFQHFGFSSKPSWGLTSGTGSQSWRLLPTWSRNLDKQYVIFCCIRVINIVFVLTWWNIFTELRSQCLLFVNWNEFVTNKRTYCLETVNSFHNADVEGDSRRLSGQYLLSELTKMLVVMFPWLRCWLHLYRLSVAVLGLTVWGASGVAMVLGREGHRIGTTKGLQPPNMNVWASSHNWTSWKPTAHFNNCIVWIFAF